MHNNKRTGGTIPCRPSSQSKSLFDWLPDFLNLLKKFKKSFDPTRKGTLTFPFHTIPPSEAFKQEELLTISVGGTICAAHSSVY